MIFTLSTRWNAGRHTSGEELVEEILNLGLTRIELGYDLRADLVPGVQRMVSEQAVAVDSVHSFCPVPAGAPAGHPELFTLASLDRDVRASAIAHIKETVLFAADLGAKAVIVHAGNVEMSSMTGKLIALFAEGRQFSPAYEKIKTKLMLKRSDRATRHLQHLQVGLEQIVPTLVDAGVVLALENLPSWESLPSEMEMLNLLQDLDCPQIRYWHDIGHAQIRQTLGFISQIRWLERLEPYLAGMHVHDVARPASDHIMPPAGDIDFKIYAPFVKPGIPVVLEPRPGLPAEDIKQAVRLLGELWQEPRLQTSL